MQSLSGLDKALTRCSMILIYPSHFRSCSQSDMLDKIRIAQELAGDVDDVRLAIGEDLAVSACGDRSISFGHVARTS